MSEVKPTSRDPQFKEASELICATERHRRDRRRLGALAMAKSEASDDDCDYEYDEFDDDHAGDDVVDDDGGDDVADDDHDDDDDDDDVSCCYSCSRSSVLVLRAMPQSHDTFCLLLRETGDSE